MATDYLLPLDQLIMNYEALLVLCFSEHPCSQMQHMDWRKMHTILGLILMIQDAKYYHCYVGTKSYQKLVANCTKNCVDMNVWRYAMKHK